MLLKAGLGCGVGRTIRGFCLCIEWARQRDDPEPHPGRPQQRPGRRGSTAPRTWCPARRFRPTGRRSSPRSSRHPGPMVCTRLVEFTPPLRDGIEAGSDRFGVRHVPRGRPTRRPVHPRLATSPLPHRVLPGLSGHYPRRVPPLLRQGFSAIASPMPLLPPVTTAAAPAQNRDPYLPYCPLLVRDPRVRRGRTGWRVAEYPRGCHHPSAH